MWKRNFNRLNTTANASKSVPLKFVQEFTGVDSWLILSQSFDKLKNIVTFYKEFIFVIIKRMNMQISTFCPVSHQTREFDVILIHGMGMMCFTSGAFQIPKSRKYNHLQSCAI